MEGIQLTDVDALDRAGIDYKTAMKTAIEAFASQIFRSGFVHGKIVLYICSGYNAYLHKSDR